MERFPKQHKSAKEKAEEPEGESRPEAAPKTESVLEATFVAPEGKPAERWRHKYYDAHGGFLAEAAEERLVEREATDLMVEGEEARLGSARLLKKFVMYGVKDGEPVEIDVLELCNQTKNDIMVAEEPLENYQYTNKTKSSVVPPLTSPLGIGVLFHEQGHAAQSHDENYKQLNDFYTISRDVGIKQNAVSFQQAKYLVGEIIKIAPEAGEILNESERKEALKRLKNEDDNRQKLGNAASEKTNEIAGVYAEETLVLQELIEKGSGAISMQALLSEFEEIEQKMSVLLKKKELEAAAQLWKELLPGFISKLEVAGFRFATGKRLSKKEEDTSERVFGEPPKKDKPDITVLSKFYAVRRLLNRINILQYKDIKIDYQVKKKKMIIEFVTASAAEAGRALLDLDIEPDDYLAMRQKIIEIKKRAAALKTEIDGMSEEIKFSEKLMQQIITTSGLGDIIAYPARFLERDATERAYQWAEQLKERAGIDLFKPLARAEIKESKTETEDCAISVIEGFHALTQKEGLVGVREDLEAAAITYGAEEPARARRKK